MKFQTSLLLLPPWFLPTYQSSIFRDSPPSLDTPGSAPRRDPSASLIKSKRDIGKRLRAWRGLRNKCQVSEQKFKLIEVWWVGGGKVFWELWRVVRWLVPAGWYEAGPHSVINYNRRILRSEISRYARTSFSSHDRRAQHEGLTRLRVRTWSSLLSIF